MSAMLHLINKSPFERTALDSCLRLAKPGSSILLIEDGVYAALENTLKKLPAGWKIFLFMSWVPMLLRGAWVTLL